MPSVEETDEASESRASLLAMPSRKEEKPAGREGGEAAGHEVAEAVRKASASLWILDAKRTMSIVLPAWSQ